LDKKTFTVELSTDSQNSIDAKDVHLALMKYFVAFVSIDVKEAIQSNTQRIVCPVCDGSKVIPNHLRKTVRKCPACKGTGQSRR